MQQTITNLKLGSRETFALTHWGNVVHKVAFGNHFTKCNLIISDIIEKRDVQASGKNLCNWCFQ